jgi:hypothetical protein
MLDGWDASAGGFPAMTDNVPFLMKDVALLAASFYLLKQDVREPQIPLMKSRRPQCRLKGQSERLTRSGVSHVESFRTRRKSCHNPNTLTYWSWEGDREAS